MTTESPGLLALLLALIALAGAWFTSSSAPEPVPLAVVDAVADRPAEKTILKLKVERDQSAAPMSANDAMELGLATSEVLAQRFSSQFDGVVVKTDFSIGAPAGSLPTFEIELAGSPPADNLRHLALASGELHLAIVADDAWAAATGLDLTKERARLQAWLTPNQHQPIARFRGLPRDQGGPHARLAWFPMANPDAAGDRWIATVVETKPDRKFAREDFEVFDKTVHGPGGEPAITFRLRPERADAFERFTESADGKRVALVCSERVLTAPTIYGALPGAGVITGRFTRRDVDLAVASVAMEPLPAPLALVSIERRSD